MTKTETEIERLERDEARLVGCVAVLLFLMGLMVGVLLTNLHMGKDRATETRTDTVYVDKWVTRTEPVASKDSLLGWDMVTIPVPKVDTYTAKVDTPELLSENLTKSVKFQQDSMTVQLPVTQRRYDDTLYTAWISGYRLNDYPRLDSIRIRQRTEYVTRTIIQMQKRKPWSVGVGVGYGLCGRQFTPFVGATLQYKIMEF